MKKVWGNYLLRGLAAIIALLVVRWSSGPIARYFLVQSAPATLGYDLTIEKAYVSPIATEMELETVCLPHPNLPLGNWLECQRIWVDVEGSPLLRKKLVIRNARAIGVRLHDPAQNTNFATQTIKRPAAWDLNVQAKHALANAFSIADAAHQIESDAGLKSDLLLEQISKAWPNEMFELENEFTVFELRAELLAEITEENADEKQPEEEAIEQAVQQVQSLEQGILAFRKRLSALQTQCEVDQKRLQDAQADDLFQLQQQSLVELPDSQSLSHYFLGAVSADQAWEVVRLVQAARAFLRQGKQAPVPSDSIALTFDYPRENSIPTFLLKALHFDGAGEFDGKPVEFAGSLQNLTNNPRVFHQPTRLVLDIHVPHRIVIEAVLDQTQDPPQEHVVIRCPNWPLPANTLGDAEQVGIATSTSVLSMRAELIIVEEEVTGTIQTRHQKIALKPRIAASWGGGRVAKSLVDLLGTIQTIDSMVTLAGPLSAPGMELKSPLGEQLAGGLQHGFEHEMSYRQQQRLANWQSQQAVVLEELQAEIDAGEKRLIARMGETGGQVQALVVKYREQYPELAKSLEKDPPHVASQPDVKEGSPRNR